MFHRFAVLAFLAFLVTMGIANAAHSTRNSDGDVEGLRWFLALGFFTLAFWIIANIFHVCP
jgi:hypothetical protein